MPVFQIITTVPVIEQLQALTETGLYGSNYGEAAERLICRALQEIFQPDLLRQSVHRTIRECAAGLVSRAY